MPSISFIFYDPEEYSNFKYFAKIMEGNHLFCCSSRINFNLQATLNVFPNNGSSTCSMNMKIGMLYQMNHIFRHTAFRYLFLSL